MNIYHVPIVPIFIMIFLVGLLQIVLSCVLSLSLIHISYSLSQTESFLRAAGLPESPLVYAVTENGRFIGYVIYHEYHDHEYYDKKAGIWYITGCGYDK